MYNQLDNSYVVDDGDNVDGDDDDYDDVMLLSEWNLCLYKQLDNQMKSYVVDDGDDGDDVVVADLSVVRTME